MRVLTYVLKAPGVDERVVAQLNELVADLRTRTGLFLQYEGLEEAEDSLVYLWSSADTAGEAIRLVYDVRFDYLYLEVDFDATRTDVESLDRAVRSRLKIADAGDLLDQAKTDQNGRALISAAVANRGAENAEMIRLVEAGLDSRRPDVKEAAILSLTVLAWTSLLPVIKRAISRENEERARAALEYMERVLSRAAAGSG
ncbi:hypothetical protein PSAC2689_10618 [Paraburkholderia sacchari]|uniref:hypothetical protein n=1 Tax=Paraburkholderia sacchari TaxID=159450 RepID=UPI0039A52C80